MSALEETAAGETSMELAPTTARILSRTHRPETLEDFGLLRPPRRWWETRKQAAAPRHGGRAVLFARGCTIADPFTGRLFLENVDLAFRAGTFTALCDRHEERSWLIAEVLTGLRECTEGTVWTRRRSAWSSARIAGTLALSPTPALDERLTVLQNILAPLAFGGLTADSDEVDRIVREVGLADRVLTPASYLSTVDRFRVATAQAVLGHVNVVVAFAPFTHRSTAECDELVELFSLMTSRGIAVIVTTSETGIAARADRVVMFSHGDVSADLISPSLDLVRSLVAQESDDPAVLGPIPVVRPPADDSDEAPAWYPVHARTRNTCEQRPLPSARIDEAEHPQAFPLLEEGGSARDTLSSAASSSTAVDSSVASADASARIPSANGVSSERSTPADSPSDIEFSAHAAVSESASSLPTRSAAAHPAAELSSDVSAAPDPLPDTELPPALPAASPTRGEAPPTPLPSAHLDAPTDQPAPERADAPSASPLSVQGQRLPSAVTGHWDDDPVTQEIALAAIAHARRLDDIDSRNAHRSDALREELRGALPSTTAAISPSISENDLIERAQQILSELPGPVTPE